MAVITTTRRTEQFHRTTPPTCKYWIVGRCNINPCRFSHSLPTLLSNVYYNANTTYKHSKKPHSSVEKMASSSVKKSINCAPKAFKKPESCALRAVECRPEAMSIEKPTKCEQKAVLIEKTVDVEDVATVAKASVDKSCSICKYWMTDNCVHGDLRQNFHSWFYGDGFSTLLKLHEHKKAITGIALPAGSDKLYSSSTDGITGVDVTLDGPKGQVLSLNVGNDILLAGAK
ncbi:hypothetical protein S83_035887, partial [Arachis hypogaea]